jgi:hypothetical protein
MLWRRGAVAKHQGDQMSLCLSHKKCSQIYILLKLIHNFPFKKHRLKFGLLLKFSKKLPMVNIRRMGENLPNLITLHCILLRTR